MDFSDYFDLANDTLTPSTLKDFENIHKVGNTVKKFKKGANLKNVETMQSVLKKGWIEKAEKKSKTENMRFHIALKKNPFLAGRQD